MVDSLVPAEFQEFNGTTPYTADLDDEESELWLIRVPENVTAEQLKNIKIPIPTSEEEEDDSEDEEDEKEDEAKAVTAISDNEGNSYSLYKVSNNVDTGIGGQEMAGLTVMMPKGGKLAFAGKAVKKYFVLEEQIDVPDTTEAAKAILAKPLLPRPQPEGLKMRFKPYGFDTGAATAAAAAAAADITADSTAEVEEDNKESKKRKREQGKEKKKKSKKTSA